MSDIEMYFNLGLIVFRVLTSQSVVPFTFGHLGLLFIFLGAARLIVENYKEEKEQAKRRRKND